MPLPAGAGVCWYCPAKLYSPIVDRMRASVSRDSRSAWKRVPGSANEGPFAERRLDDVLLIDLGDRWKRDDLPPFLPQDMAYEIVLVQALHDDHDRAPPLVIEAGIERAVKPFVSGDATGFQRGVAGLERIVDDDEIRAAAGENAPDRRRQPKPALGRDDFL
jgi:hypothetical protein